MPGAYTRPADGRTAGVELAFYVEDVAAAYDRAAAAGAAVVTPPRQTAWGQTVAYVRAPEGTVIGLCSPMGDADGSA